MLIGVNHSKNIASSTEKLVFAHDVGCCYLALVLCVRKPIGKKSKNHIQEGCYHHESATELRIRS